MDPEALARIAQLEEECRQVGTFHYLRRSSTFRRGARLALAGCFPLHHLQLTPLRNAMRLTTSNCCDQKQCVRQICVALHHQFATRCVNLTASGWNLELGPNAQSDVRICLSTCPEYLPQIPTITPVHQSKKLAVVWLEQAQEEAAAYGAQAQDLEASLQEQRAVRPIQMPVIQSFEAFSSQTAGKKKKHKHDKAPSASGHKPKHRPHKGSSHRDAHGSHQHPPGGSAPASGDKVRAWKALTVGLLPFSAWSCSTLAGASRYEGFWCQLQSCFSHMQVRVHLGACPRACISIDLQM